MQAFANGDSAAFERLYQRYRQPLYNFIKRQLPDDRVDELFQDVWESLIKASSHYQPCAQFQSYLYRICRNKIIDFWRCYKQHDEFEESLGFQGGMHSLTNDIHSNESNSLELELCKHKQQTALEQAINRLPAAQKEAFLFKGAGFSVQDIGSITEVGFETAKSRLKLAFRSLREQLKALRSDL